MARPYLCVIPAAQFRLVWSEFSDEDFGITRLSRVACFPLIVIPAQAGNHHSVKGSVK
jgi:hypothetical protein